MLWWFEYYKEFAAHLGKYARLVTQKLDTGAVYQLIGRGLAFKKLPAAASLALPAFAPWTREQIEALRPKSIRDWQAPAAHRRPRVLVLGIYLAAKPNAVVDIVEVLGESRHYRVTQKWVALGGRAPTPRVSKVTVQVLNRKVPKFEILNQLLKREDLSRYDFVVSVDDDIVLPRGFLDDYLALQQALNFGLAQPARTPNSFIDHWITEQNPGLSARQTLFVEVGPVFSVHRSLYGEVFPFDLTSPMGWGYPNLWAALAQEKGFKLGIIDATPVDHSLRAPLTYYDRGTVEEERATLLRKHQCLTILECYRVLDAVIPVRRKLLHQPARAPSLTPQISVVIPTSNRSPLLRKALESLVEQTVDPNAYEVIVVDDGSTDNTPAICEEFARRMSLHYCCVRHSGPSVARNLGVFLASAPLIIFLDDDEASDRDLLRQHIVTHQVYPNENWAVLGYTTWSPHIPMNPVMEYVTDIGQSLFAYQAIKHGQLLDFSYFWCGRISCKRSFLRHAMFDRRFLNMQDVELGRRLAKFGLQIVHNRNAKNEMTREMTFDEFCRRSVRQGRAQYLFSQVHRDPESQKYCHLVPDARARLQSMSLQLDEKTARALQLQAVIESGKARVKLREMRAELHALYAFIFTAHKTRGIVEAMPVN